MNITPEMITEDEKLWHARDVITELCYCGNHMRDRKNITNLDIRFYAYIMRKAHELLKKQEPRVMTREEIILCSDWVWCEYSSGYQGWYKMEEYDKEYGLFRWDDTTTDIVDDYGMRWRCWTSRPSEEQRKAVPWDE